MLIASRGNSAGTYGMYLVSKFNGDYRECNRSKVSILVHTIILWPRFWLEPAIDTERTCTSQSFSLLQVGADQEWAFSYSHGILKVRYTVCILL